MADEDRKRLVEEIAQAHEGSDAAFDVSAALLIFEQARALADECGAPHALGFLVGATGMAAMLQGRFADDLAASDDAEGHRERYPCGHLDVARDIRDCQSIDHKEAIVDANVLAVMVLFLSFFLFVGLFRALDDSR